MTEEPEPDAYLYTDLLRPEGKAVELEKVNFQVDEDRQPLWSAETIQEQIEDIWHSFTPEELPKEDLNGARKMKKELEEVFSSDEQ